jgi:deazaflavin-dependent oxidoreductase (nitroreductase family)
MDKALFEMSNGGMTVASVLAGLPVIMVTTTGAKSGLARHTPLVGIPVDEDLAVIGSNYGQGPTPGWVYNLEADPTATVAYKERSVRVAARRADQTAADYAFSRASAVYAGYAGYRERAGHREIRVFVLEPAN